MPRRDGFGPEGRGPLTGRGMGHCSNPNRDLGFRGRRRSGRALNRGFAGRRFNRGFNRGFGPGFCFDYFDEKSEKELLEEGRDFLISQLEEIDEYLERL